MAEPSLRSQPKIGIPYWAPNIVGYIRLAMIIASWRYGLTDPITYTALYTISYSLDAVDGMLARHLG